jgi:hypothetical protein
MNDIDDCLSSSRWGRRAHGKAGAEESMMSLNLVVLILCHFTLGLLIVSKFADCLSTQLFVRYETNRLGRWLMERIGRIPAIWLIFIFVCCISIATWAPVAMHGSYMLYGISFIFSGSLISLFQFAVAFSNYTGASNPITRLVSSWRIHR